MYIAWIQEAFSTDRGEVELECEYCYKREKELCSPMVQDMSVEEAEAFLKEQEAVRSCVIISFICIRICILCLFFLLFHDRFSG